MAEVDLRWAGCGSAEHHGEPVAPVPPTLVGVSRGFPIGVDGEARTVLLYLVLQPWTDGFRAWLQAHVAWLQRLRSWTIRLVFPRPLDRTYDAHQRVIREEFETPLQSATVQELKWCASIGPRKLTRPSTA